MKPKIRKGLKIMILLSLLITVMVGTVHFYLFALSKLKHKEHQGLIAFSAIISENNQ